MGLQYVANPAKRRCAPIELGGSTVCYRTVVCRRLAVSARHCLVPQERPAIFQRDVAISLPQRAFDRDGNVSLNGKTPGRLAGVHDPGGPGCLSYFAATTFCFCSPSPSMPSVTTSPAFRNFGAGFMPSADARRRAGDDDVARLHHEELRAVPDQVLARRRSWSWCCRAGASRR